MVTEVGVLVLVAAAVILGTVVQRVSGMGVGLVVSPTLVLLLGPVAGVLLTNLTTTASAALIAVAVRQDIDWRRYRQVAPLIIAGSIPGALLVRAVDRGWLEVTIGTLLLATLIVSTVGRLPVLNGRGPAAAAGAVGGFLNTAVGVAAPAMLVYAQATRWSQRSFAATLQPIFCTMGATSLITKFAVGATAVSGPPPAGIAVTAVIMVPVGLLVGNAVARWVPASTGRRVAVTVVVVGALATLTRGLLAVTQTG